MRRLLLFLIVGLTPAALASFAKGSPGQVVVWPPSGAPVVRFTFGKFKEIGSLGGQRSYTIDTTAENLWGKKIPDAAFTLYLFDKNKTRIGEGWISLSNVEVGETVKFQVSVGTSGAPVALEVVPRTLPRELQAALPARTIFVTVNSIPQGAAVKLDGVDAGTTPKVVQVGVGKHMLEFSKEGFNAGRFPLEIGSDDVSGGNMSYELGTAAHDTIELRDGSVLTGDLETVSATEVVIRLGETCSTSTATK